MVSAQIPAQPFSWPCPSTVEIKEKALKRGHTAELRYQLVCSEGEKGSRRFRLQGLQFDKIDGEPVAKEVLQQLQAAIQSFDELPAFMVDSQGRLADVENMDKLLQSMAKAGSSQGNALPDRVLKDPKVAQMMKLILMDYWQCWVEHWIDFPAKSGEPVSDVIQQSFVPNTAAVSMNRTMEVLPPSDATPGTRHLRMKSEMTGRQLAEFLKSLVPDQPDKAGQGLDDLPEARCFKIYEVKQDVEKRLPVWARRETNITLKEGKDDRFPPQVETHEYQFLWPAGK